jgi:hypothetical protein
MTRDEVRNLMHDYYDNLLSADEKSRIESYLEEFEDIAKEYELLRKLLDKAQTLPIGIKTPKSVLEKVSDELLTKSLEKIESDKQKKLRELTENTEKEGEKRKKLKKIGGITSSQISEPSSVSSKKFPKKILIIVLVLLLCIAGYFAYDYLITNLPWQLRAEYGQYQIGPNISSKQTLNEQEVLSTLDSSKVALTVPNAGRIELRSFSSVQLIKGKDKDNIISLLSGKLYAECKIDDPRLTIKTLPVNIIAKGGDFSVDVDDQGDVNVKTQNGIVLLESSKEKLLLIQDHVCKVKPNGNIGIPYHIDAAPELVQLIYAASFDEQKVFNPAQILALATPLDGITLLYLIKEINNRSDRSAIYQKLSEFYPPPPGITQEGIINLNEEMFETWLNDIEWQI